MAKPSHLILSLLAVSCLAYSRGTAADEKPSPRVYQNQLTLLKNPAPILADFPEFAQPVEELQRFEAPVLIDDSEADLQVRAWRFSYNARGIIEIPNRLKASKTAVIVVHPWGIDDGQGWRTPEPAGAAFAGTPEKNKLMLRHAEAVINPFLKSLRSRVGLVMYSLPGKQDAIRKKLYRSFNHQPTADEHKQGELELAHKLQSFNYRGEDIPREITLTSGKPAIDYFQQFQGGDSSSRYDSKGFWELPIPVMKPIDVAPTDFVIYDVDGYKALKEFLISQGIEHVLLCGYHADMCVCSTTAGYDNLRKDFNVFLVADAVQSTLPANRDSRYATNQTISFASLKVLITQVSWVK
jgi:nicotinamidase-related amidase